jgi:DNA-binding HxlR family transcriptional regulator
METNIEGTRDEKPQSAAPTKCPLTAAITAIGGKWNMIVLYWLDSGMRRFNELRRLMPEISHKVLAATLRDLEREGLVTRKVYAEVPPRVEYRLSTHGQTVRPIIEAVRVWGHVHIASKEPVREPSETLINAVRPRKGRPTAKFRAPTRRRIKSS